ncbi:hypothetical protein ABID16_003402 [Rhizobium aquaticum]|uniref:4-amino-4-deoxy-L-arabinose transferase-like glycosyltransferase n=1 Tax=Rhizobium aquaticum TaxID=1549636 RepID=A0ABV2J2R6_9HYPH
MQAGRQHSSPHDREVGHLVSFAFLCFLLACGIAWEASKHVELATAYFGFSPVGMMHPVSTFVGFGLDFPNGEGEMMKSLVGWLYATIGQLNVLDFNGSFGVIFLEVIVFLGGTYSLARRLNADLPRWTCVAAAVVLAAGSFVSADFSRWFHPYYGSVYNFAYGLGLAAIAAAMGRKMVLSGFLVGVALAVHPIIGLFCGVAMAAVVVADLPNYRLAAVASGMLAAASVFAIWYLVAFRGAAIGGGAVDHHAYAALTRLMSFHWFPLELEVFGARAWEVLLPFTAAVLIILATIPLGSPATSLPERQIAAALVALLAVSVLGLLLSEITENPFLIKLALQRASLVFLIVGMALAAPRLFVLLTNGPLWLLPIVALLLLSPFWRSHGIPVSVAIVFGIAVQCGALGAPKPASKFSLATGILAAVGVCVWLIAGGDFGAVSIDIRQTFNGLLNYRLLAAFFLVGLARIIRNPIPVAVALAIGSYLWLPQVDAMRDPQTRERAQAFLEVQEWARKATPPGSLFMLDPTGSYGWRQYSQRPSFGVLREWLYSGWIYNPKPEILNEGLRRAGLLGLSSDDLAIRPGESPDDARARIADRAAKAFNGLDASSIQRMAKDNGISYFVFDRAGRENLNSLDVVYQNNDYAVVQPQ